MKILLIFCLMMASDLILAQSVIVKGTGAGNARGKATEGSYVPNATNMAVTGTLTPDVTGTEYVSIGNSGGGYPAWSNTVSGYFIYRKDGPSYYVIYSILDSSITAASVAWNKGDSDVIGNYAPAGVNATGTATVAYSIVTNTFPATAVIHGIATP